MIKINAASRLKAASGWAALSVNADSAEDGEWSQPINALGQGELVNAALHKVVAERLQDYVKRLKKMGIKQLGSGNFADVFQHPTMPNVVVKLLTDHDAGYEKYVKFSAAHKGNKYVPKILQVVEADDAFDKKGEYDMGNLRLVFMEKLTPMKDAEYLKFANHVMATAGYGADLTVMRHAINALNVPLLWTKVATQKEDKDLAQVAEFIIKTRGGNIHMDLHADNVMLRGSQVIITDPFSTYD